MGFAKTQTGLEYALAIDATNKTASEVHQMAADERYLTAVLRSRWYQHLYGGGGQQGP
jgi:hypothetical protein